MSFQRPKVAAYGGIMDVSRMASLKWLRRAALGLGLIGLLAGIAPRAMAGGKSGSKASFSYFVTGTQYLSPTQLDANGHPKWLVSQPTAQPTTIKPLVLMGGGPDVDEAYRWMINRAGIKPGTGGRFVVIRTTGTDAYDPYFYYSDANNSTTIPAVDGYVGGAYLGLTAAETLVLTNSAAANDPFVNYVVSTANAVWIAGGDQSTYVNLWTGSQLQKTLADLLSRNIPVGGTSAGANVLGQFMFSALNGSVTSKQALSNPYNKYMTFDPTDFKSASFLAPTGQPFIPVLANTFVDPHFDSRDRMGRLVTFMARSTQGCSGGVIPVATANLARGIGIDVETALEIEQDASNGHYKATRVTNISTTTTSAVHFLTPTPLSGPGSILCASGKPLTISYINALRLADSTTEFDINNWWTSPTTKQGTTTYYSVGVNTGAQSPALINY